MIYIDHRIGSVEFKPLLVRLGAPCKIKRLKFADFRFYGNGKDNARVRIGIERKTVSEICGAIGDSRFTGHQLPGLLRTYDYVWLVIEGWQTVDAASGVLMQGKWSAGYGAARHLFGTVRKFELTLSIKGNIRVVHTKNKTETAYFIRALYDWWNEKWKKHKSIYRVEETKPAVFDADMLDERTLKRRVAAQLPKIGWVRSSQVHKAFGTIREMINANEEEWRAALKFKEGRLIAAAIVAACSKKEES